MRQLYIILLFIGITNLLIPQSTWGQCAGISVEVTKNGNVFTATATINPEPIGRDQEIVVTDLYSPDTQSKLVLPGQTDYLYFTYRCASAYGVDRPITMTVTLTNPIDCATCDCNLDRKCKAECDKCNKLDCATCDCNLDRKCKAECDKCNKLDCATCDCDSDDKCKAKCERCQEEPRNCNTCHCSSAIAMRLDSECQAVCNECNKPNCATCDCDSDDKCKAECNKCNKPDCATCDCDSDDKCKAECDKCNKPDCATCDCDSDDKCKAECDKCNKPDCATCDCDLDHKCKAECDKCNRLDCATCDCDLDSKCKAECERCKNDGGNTGGGGNIVDPCAVSALYINANPTTDNFIRVSPHTEVTLSVVSAAPGYIYSWYEGKGDILLGSSTSSTYTITSHEPNSTKSYWVTGRPINCASNFARFSEYSITVYVNGDVDPCNNAGSLGNQTKITIPSGGGLVTTEGIKVPKNTYTQLILSNVPSGALVKWSTGQSTHSINTGSINQTIVYSVKIYKVINGQECVIGTRNITLMPLECDLNLTVKESCIFAGDYFSLVGSGTGDKTIALSSTPIGLPSVDTQMIRQHTQDRPGTYTYELKNGSCSKSLKVNVLPAKFKPSIKLHQKTYVYINDEILLEVGNIPTGVDNNDFDWNHPMTYVGKNGNNYLYKTTLTTPTTYELTIKKETCELGRNSLQVTPIATGHVQVIGQEQEYNCATELLALEVIDAPYTTYQWFYQVDGKTEVPITEATNRTLSILPYELNLDIGILQHYNFICKTQNPNTKKWVRSTAKKITIIGLPPLNMNDTYCVDYHGGITIDSKVRQGIVTWYPLDGNNNPIETQKETGYTLSLSDVITDQRYKVIVKDEDCLQEHDFEVHIQPTKTGVITGKQTMCAGGSNTLVVDSHHSYVIEGLMESEPPVGYTFDAKNSLNDLEFFYQGHAFPMKGILNHQPHQSCSNSFVNFCKKITVKAQDYYGTTPGTIGYVKLAYTNGSHVKNIKLFNPQVVDYYGIGEEEDAFTHITLIHEWYYQEVGSNTWEKIGTGETFDIPAHTPEGRHQYKRRTYRAGCEGNSVETPVFEVSVWGTNQPLTPIVTDGTQEGETIYVSPNTLVTFDAKRTDVSWYASENEQKGVLLPDRNGVKQFTETITQDVTYWVEVVGASACALTAIPLHVKLCPTEGGIIDPPQQQVCLEDNLNIVVHMPPNGGSDHPVVCKETNMLKVILDMLPLRELATETDLILNSHINLHGDIDGQSTTFERTFQWAQQPESPIRPNDALYIQLTNGGVVPADITYNVFDLVAKGNSYRFIGQAIPLPNNAVCQQGFIPPVDLQYAWYVETSTGSVLIGNQPHLVGTPLDWGLEVGQTYTIYRRTYREEEQSCGINSTPFFLTIGGEILQALPEATGVGVSPDIEINTAHKESGTQIYYVLQAGVDITLTASDLIPQDLITQGGTVHWYTETEWKKYDTGLVEFTDLTPYQSGVEVTVEAIQESGIYYMVVQHPTNSCSELYVRDIALKLCDEPITYGDSNITYEVLFEGSLPALTTDGTTGFLHTLAPDGHTNPEIHYDLYRCLSCVEQDDVTNFAFDATTVSPTDFDTHFKLVAADLQATAFEKQALEEGFYFVQAKLDTTDARFLCTGGLLTSHLFKVDIQSVEALWAWDFQCPTQHPNVLVSEVGEVSSFLYQAEVASGYEEQGLQLDTEESYLVAQPSAQQMALFDGSKAFSAALWMKYYPTQQDGIRTLLHVPNRFHLYLRTQAGVSEVALRMSGSMTILSATIEPKVWQHIGFTWKAGTAQLYLHDAIHQPTVQNTATGMSIHTTIAIPDEQLYLGDTPANLQGHTSSAAIGQLQLDQIKFFEGALDAQFASGKGLTDFQPGQGCRSPLVPSSNQGRIEQQPIHFTLEHGLCHVAGFVEVKNVSGLTINQNTYPTITKEAIAYGDVVEVTLFDHPTSIKMKMGYLPERAVLKPTEVGWAVCLVPQAAFGEENDFSYGFYAEGKLQYGFVREEGRCYRVEATKKLSILPFNSYDVLLVKRNSIGNIEFYRNPTYRQNDKPTKTFHIQGQHSDIKAVHNQNWTVKKEGQLKSTGVSFLPLSEEKQHSFLVYQTNRVLQTGATTYDSQPILDKTSSKVKYTEYVATMEQHLWKSNASYAYVNEGESRTQHVDPAGTPHLDTDGTMTLNWFKWEQQGLPAYTPDAWIRTNRVTRYNAKGMGTETRDLYGFYGAALYGHQQQLVIASGANSRYDEIGFEGFENTSYDGNIDIEKSSQVHRQYILEEGLNTKAYTKENLSHVPDELAKASTQWYLKSYYVHLSEQRNVTHDSQQVTSPVIGYDTQTQKSTLCFEDDLWQFDPTIPNGDKHWEGQLVYTYTQENANQALSKTTCYLTDKEAHTGKQSLKLKAPRVVFNQYRLRPIPGKTYVLSAWMRANEEGTFPTGHLQVTFSQASGQQPQTFTFRPTGNVVEGWQRIESTFTVPRCYADFQIVVKAPEQYLDDLRLFPAQGNMQSFVYDAQSYRLSATLDQNNYATYYYYNSEGQLFLTKRETARGVYTIQESMGHIHQKTGQ